MTSASSWLLVGLAVSLTACRASATTDAAAADRTVLLFTGHGTSAGDVAALERVLADHHFGYATVNSSRLNGMRESELRTYRLPQSWRRGMTFTTPADVDNAYAATLIDAALRRTRLAHY